MFGFSGSDVAENADQHAAASQADFAAMRMKQSNSRG
jgi:hypothetical protein